MRSSKPPALASWLVDHLIPGVKNDALAGDLLEQFSKGRSVAWYWRQALVAIFVGFSKELHILWVAASFTIVWISILAGSRQWLIYIFRSLRSRSVQAVFSWGVTRPWPVSEIFTIAFLAVLTGSALLISLTIYLSARECCGLRQLAQGLLGGLVGFPLGLIAGMVLPIHGRPGSFAGYVVMSMPLFFSLLVSLWAVRPTTKTGGATGISA